MDVRLIGNCENESDLKKPILQSTEWPKSTGTIENGDNKIGKPSEEEEQHPKQLAADQLHPTPELYTYGGIKLGWIQGVLIPCLLNIWGVMLFLRIAWVVAQAGIGLSLVIITLSGVVFLITTLSLSAICTNGQLQGGGVYYLVSRSLGAELGASVGIIFAFANAVAASMNTIGFCESLNELLKSHGVKIIDNNVNDIRIVGAIALFVMCIICAVGMDWETKAQNFLITVIVLAIFNYIIGAFLGPLDDETKAEGFFGISLEMGTANWAPDFRYSEGQKHNFFSVFAVYFPAVTGVQAGANICGDLKDPATAIPKGTLLSLVISITSYYAMAVLSGMGALRDASGDTSNLTAAALEACKPNCEYGLHNNYQIMQLMALWGPLIYAGCWAATLSTALTNLLSVPRLIQALGIDRIYPGLIFFSKRYGRHGEPYRGYVLTFCVSLLFLLIADLNTIAPLITNFYLASYALINFCTFHAAFVQHLNWRPTFRFYNKWLSFAGFIICAMIMLIISWIMALTTIFIFMTLYLLVLYRNPDANWGSSTEGQRYQQAIAFIMQLSQHTGYSKTYNPQLLVLAGKPFLRPALLDIANLITKIGSFMVVADIDQSTLMYEERVVRTRIAENWLRSRKYRAFYVLVHGYSFERGAIATIQAAGLGRLSPNILLLGFKEKWRISSQKDINAYFKIIQHAFLQQIAVAIFRTPGTARKKSSSTPSFATDTDQDESNMHSEVLTLMNCNSDTEEDDTSRSEWTDSQAKDITISSLSAASDLISVNSSVQEPKVTSPNTVYHKPLTFSQENSIDVWWLYDDGGLNILLPYIIARRGRKEKMPMRIFAFTKGQLNVHEAKKHMEELLAKFRIEYSRLTLVQGSSDPPSEDSWALWNSIIKDFKTTENSEVLISEAEHERQLKKITRYLRLRELLLQYSYKADLIVISLPFPRKDAVSAALYMAWLEVVSQNLPPMLFVRGNNTYIMAA
ncbi:LOW QUALITY PROTEIN: bumetanide-sensitive sodium-(potassium)-chloride cotransporter-like [Manduca sexta]|uniref:LOW QUALITY PROTEIN: bumetanide-sensitive sodium-(potassium)-chloride cotransporter-like n=1 Tax=Manduca sexta TaxID=7130 RepID=UPI00188EDFDF|nr:LOW QUALITY PROTEIN: bumetanide-sensitive sodium-(potassium)-chloride cotransporter-like [Manduca sexta]